MPLQFEMPASLTVEKFVSQLSMHITLQCLDAHPAQKIFYDSFDWRLFAGHITCELTCSKDSRLLALRDAVNGKVLANTESDQMPIFGHQFSEAKIRNILEPILEIRALIKVCELVCRHYQVNLINGDGKTEVRLLIEEHGQLNHRVYLHALKGYDKVAHQCVETLVDQLGLMPVTRPLLLDALSLHGRVPLDYSAKFSLVLEPGTRADLACKAVYTSLLAVLKANQQGTIKSIDTEFLHDFRVAVRKTRSGLSQLKSVFPDADSRYYREFFSWLGKLTGPVRDLDVFLLNFKQHKNSLPVSIREDLEPFNDFLQVKRQHEQQKLAANLKSGKYRSIITEWENYLGVQLIQHPEAANAALPIKELANRRVWKMFNQVMNEGEAIHEQSAAECLHELRKTCKKLRYLLEFFQSLYPENNVKQLIKNLKVLQDVLGEIQDYQIQEDQLRAFSEEMRVIDKIPANTFLAMGVLIQNLDIGRCQARSDFKSKFADFKQADNQMLYKTLFHSKN